MQHFPMFLAMAGRDVVIVGGAEQAAQKARLIARTPARLTLLAAELEPELAGLAASGRTARVADPAQAPFERAALVFVATGCPGADAALAALARARGAGPVNVVDQPALCDAFTPAIVDRAPLVVAIGTEGAAPVLGRQIRARIEAMLEPGLGELAALAGRLRGAVAARIPKPQRRAFWDWAFAGPPRELAARGARHAAARALKAALAAGGPGPAPGRITLVGAGPGAADLLTLRALQRLQEADAIFYDRLVDPAVLDLARRDAERICVGKAVGARDWPQDRIDALIVAAARRGRHVVRLKSGDPGIFGRAEEELAAARAAGIAAEIVPGVTAASAAAAGLGRALTERGQSDHLVLATATCRPGDPARDWAGLLRPGGTLAVYMGMRNAPAVQAGLLAAGVPPGIEAEVVAEAATPRARHLVTTLGALAPAIAAAGLRAPAVILLRWPKGAASRPARSRGKAPCPARLSPVA